MAASERDLCSINGPTIGTGIWALLLQLGQAIKFLNCKSECRLNEQIKNNLSLLGTN